MPVAISALRKFCHPTFCRGLVSDDESNQAATADAFAVLHLIAEKRLAAGKLTVIDATNVQKEARKPFLELAKSQNVLPVVIVLDVPAEICHGVMSVGAIGNLGLR